MDKDKKCDFYIKDEDGNLLKCDRQSCGGITRKKEFCRTHYRLLKDDNIKRNELGLDIPSNLDLIIRFSKRARLLCTKKIDEEPKDEIIEGYDENAEYSEEEWKLIAPFVDGEII